MSAAATAAVAAWLPTGGSAATVNSGWISCLGGRCRGQGSPMAVKGTAQLDENAGASSSEALPRYRQITRQRGHRRVRRITSQRFYD